MSETVLCKECGKEFSKYGIKVHFWRVHGEGVKFDSSKYSWNRGLTKETDPRVRNNSESLKKHFSKNFSELRKTLQPKLDDDGKLYERYSNKRVNARYEGLECELTFDEYLLLVYEAGLVSSQLGFKGEGYVLARYNDEGNYTYSNCRFITQKDNAAEKKLSEAVVENGKIQGKKLNEYRKHIKETDPELYAEWIERSRRAKAEKQGKQYSPFTLKPVDTHNSQYGTFWITDGKENKKWSDKKGDLPEGFYRGRTVLTENQHI